MRNLSAFLLFLVVSFSVSAQTDAQLDQLRAEVKKFGLENVLIQAASMFKANARGQNIPEGWESLDITASGTVMTTTWRAVNAEFKDIDKTIELQAKNYTLKTVCNQRVRGMLIREFGATMLSRYIDKNNRFMWEVRVDKESCGPAQVNESLQKCNELAGEAMKTMTRETRQTRRSFSDCEIGERGRVAMVHKVDYKEQPGKGFDDQKVALMGSDAFVGRGVCNSPTKNLMTIFNFDYRVETYFEGNFITATTVSPESCASISSDAKSMTPRDNQQIETLLSIDTLGIKRFLQVMTESVNSKSGQNVSPIVNIHSASFVNQKMVYEYRVTVARERFDYSRLEELRAKERASTCNEQTMKLLISLFDVSMIKRYSDPQGEFLFESSSSREECRRVWRQ
jgi:hypothetical protein